MSTRSQTSSTSTPAGPRSSRGPRLVVLLPLLAFVGIAAFLAVGLTLNPRELPSALIGKPVPAFSLPPVRGRALGLAATDLKGQVSLVNVFASWCVACREEHPLLIRIRRDNLVPIHGLNYKDQPAAAARWLDDLGDPYTRTGADLDGRVAIEWGVYGVPETFVVDGNGTIAYKHIGAMTPSVWQQKMLPLIRKLRESSP